MVKRSRERTRTTFAHSLLHDRRRKQGEGRVQDRAQRLSSVNAVESLSILAIPIPQLRMHRNLCAVGQPSLRVSNVMANPSS